MKKTLLRFITTVFAVAFMAVLMPSFAFADSGGYTTEAFDVNVVTDEDHVFHVEEEITVNFYEYRHGIYRYIPENGNLYELKHIRVDGYDYETYSENNSMVVKIGSGDYEVYGKQKYRITYDIVGFKDTDPNADHLAIDLLPTGWGTAISSSKLTITFPKRIDDIDVFCGSFEETGDSGYFLTSQDGKSLTAVARELVPRGFGYTITADLPEGYWVNPKDKAAALPGFYGVLGVLAALMLGLWALLGRDKAVIKPVEFYPPDGMDPLQVDYIANDKIDSKDVAAQFMHYANKGYLRVIQGDKKEFSLEKIKGIGSDEPLHSRSIFRELFSEGSNVDMKHMPSGLGECIAKIQSDVKASFGENARAFTKSSVVGRFVGYCLCAIVPLIAGFAFTYCSYEDWGFYILTILLALLIGWLSRSLIRKADSFAGKKKPVRFVINAIFLLAFIAAETAMILTKQPLLAVMFLAAMMVTLISTIFVRQRANNDIYGRVMGFKNFIKTAEYDRLKALSDEDPSYFFNILPYAYILGMSTKWADKFADFKLPQPSWYVGRDGGYDPFFHGYMFSSFSHGIGSSVGDYYKSISADIAGDIGGGGGGGFSGGGFGGGGGGSW